MEEVAEVVNQHAKEAKQPSKSVDEVAMGFIRVANETMCRPIRALTQMRASSHCLQQSVLKLLTVIRSILLRGHAPCRVC
jgi:Hydantoinase/oxoprolinase